jgi:hypothetical protein
MITFYGEKYLSIHKMTLICLIFMSIFIWQIGFPRESVSVDNQPDAVLRFELEALPSYIAGEPVQITFVLENLTRRDVYVLTWYTPLEGLKGKILKVTRDGVEIPYEGRMIKRGEPGRKDYLHISPLESVSFVVDLTPAYDMNTPGDYHVEFIKRIHDFTFDEKTIPKKQAEHQGGDISGNAVSFRIIKS